MTPDLVSRGLQAFDRLDLRRKITIALLAAALGIGGVVTMTSYFLARYHLSKHAIELLSARAELEQREIELAIAAAVRLASSIAENTVTANALADSQGRETYLDPLLRNQDLGIPGAELIILDYKGRAIAGMKAGRMSANILGSRSGPMSAETADAWINDGFIVATFPIHYKLSGNVEGTLVLRMPMAPLLPRGGWADARALATPDRQPVAGMMPDAGEFTVSIPLALPNPIDRLGLKLVVARNADAVHRALDILLLVFIGVGIFVLGGVLAFSQLGARYITAPLGHIAAAAEEIAASGRPVARLPDIRGDEFGRLVSAFNTMVARLRESYGELENLVAERTRDYEESQQEAERVSKLLDEAVQNIAVGFTVYDQDDRLVVCNEAYLSLYEESRDLIVPGATFEQIVRNGALRGQYAEACGDVEKWVATRVAQHQAADGKPVEQRLGDGRWLLIIEHRTPSGYIVGNRIDITALKRATEELRRRELYLQATLDNLPFFFWLKDAEGRFLAVNKVFSDACGRADPEAVVGLTDFEVWPLELAAKYVADDRLVMEGREPRSVEERVAGGSDAGWIETYKKPVVLPDGRVLGTVGFARDISGRKRMEQALGESEERFELAVSGANDGIWDWNTVTGQAYFSLRWKSMLGYDEGEIGNDIEEWRSRVHPDDIERVLKELERHFIGESRFYVTELRLRCKDGSYKWILCRGRAKFDDHGNPVRMSGSHTDITERREAEARIHDRNEQLNAIFSLSPDGFVSFDSARRVKYASPAFHRMTGIDEAMIAGLDEDRFASLLAEACIKEARFPTMDELRETRKVGGRTPRRLIELAGAGQRVLEVGIRLSHAESVSQILYFRDVTHETEVDRMKSEFLSTAAHELRTPMASIYGFSELMLVREFAREEQTEFLTAIHSQAELMTSIINELLDLARIEARRGKDFIFERLSLADLVSETVAGFNPTGGRSSPELVLSGMRGHVRADRNKLRQAINNVLSNAYKYSPGGGEVRLELVDGEECGFAGRIGVRVTDRGIGMTPAQLERVCERFYRADTSGKIPGTGLGMSIVKEIIDLHGGEIRFNSAPGLGTEVTLWLPSAGPGTEQTT